jgi:Purple acid Phosphatase, N-terminal domain
MKRLLVTLAIAVMINSVIVSHATAQPHPAAQHGEPARIVDGPALEAATDHSAILGWAANTRGGTAVHYGVVRYGTDPQHLSQTAKSPNRWNKNLPSVRYRVRVDGLQPGMTYYYTVGMVQADGTSLGVTSPVHQFTTRQRP